MELVVDDQVNVYMDENHVHEIFQSAYDDCELLDGINSHL